MKTIIPQDLTEKLYQTISDIGPQEIRLVVAKNPDGSWTFFRWYYSETLKSAHETYLRTAIEAWLADLPAIHRAIPGKNDPPGLYPLVITIYEDLSFDPMGQPYRPLNPEYGLKFTIEPDDPLILFQQQQEGGGEDD